MKLNLLCECLLSLSLWALPITLVLLIILIHAMFDVMHMIHIVMTFDA